MGLALFGSLFGEFAAEYLGARSAVALGAGLCLVMTLAFSKNHSSGQRKIVTHAG